MKDKSFLIGNGIDVDKSLELFGDMSMYNETLQEFLDGVQKKIEDLNKSKEASDTHNYSIYAHSLKSDARYLGFTTLAELAYNHEMAGKNSDVSYIYDNYDSLINETKRIIKVVSEYLGVYNDSLIRSTSSNITKSDKAILVVDDSDLVTSFIKKIFNDTYEVIIAFDGSEALKYVSEDSDNKIVGMFLDLNMPNVNGFQVLEYFNINDLFTRIPVTLITGVDTKDEITKALTYPVVDILSKPFNEKNIKNAIEKMTRK